MASSYANAFENCYFLDHQLTFWNPSYGGCILVLLLLLLLLLYIVHFDNLHI